ncbi:hypothetical protein GGI20_005413 [Coemansia sp. BCRC 34301]|nr:hypothetical protein GGI20_005413 [Coemansia sp. BCRC 34301]
MNSIYRPIKRCFHSISLDDAGLALVRQRLAKEIRSPRFTYSSTAGDAAVLLLLCTTNGVPGILFEERRRDLSSHGGEVCFAGGKADPSDRSLVHTALRETFEELGLRSVNVLGCLPPVPNRSASLRVHPVVGSVGELDLGALVLNRDEVHRAFVLPLTHFACEENKSVGVFRDTGVALPTYATDKRGLRIWGLTAYILHEFLRRVERM